MTVLTLLADLCLFKQVMVPGKTHLSLTVAWALDHDPEAAVKQASSQAPIPEDEAVDLHQGNQVRTLQTALLMQPLSA